MSRALPVPAARWMAPALAVVMVCAVVVPAAAGAAHTSPMPGFQDEESTDPETASPEQEVQEDEEDASGGEASAGQEQEETDDPADLFSGRTAAEQRALDLVEEMLREEEGVLAGGDYSYASSGRRDPFRSLLQATRQAEAPTVRPPGLAGMLVQEVRVKGIAEYLDRHRAILVGPDGRTHFAAVGAELFDGRVVEIGEDAVVFEQEVRDVLGARSTRRVVRRLENEGQGD